jgi:hypothetical protein
MVDRFTEVGEDMVMVVLIGEVGDIVLTGVDILITILCFGDK